MTVDNNQLPILSIDEAMQFVGNPDLFVEIAEMLLDELPEQMEFLRLHWANRDLRELSKTAHRLKGNFGIVAAAQAQVAAKALEHAAKDGDVEASATAVTELEAAVERVVPELEGHISSAAS